MINYMICKLSGKIDMIGVCSLSSIDSVSIADDEIIVFSHADFMTHYIANVGATNDIAARPAQTVALDKTTLTADGIDSIAITNAPSGTFTATNTATKETVTGPMAGTDTFSTTIPGTYIIKITSWPYLDFETTIEAI